MGQSKLLSFLEALTNALIGYIVGLSSQLVIFYIYNIDIPLKENMIMAIWFMAISITRSYIIRRMFNDIHTIILKINNYILKGLDDMWDVYYASLTHNLILIKIGNN